MIELPKVVKSYYNLADPKQAAYLFSISLIDLGHSSEIVKILYRNGWRVIFDNKMVDFYSDKGRKSKEM